MLLNVSALTRAIRELRRRRRSHRSGSKADLRSARRKVAQAEARRRSRRR